MAAVTLKNFVIARNFAGRCFGGRTQCAALLFALTFVLASCGGSSSSSSGPMPTASLTAAPATVVAGQSITLTWASTNADMGTIDNGVGQVGLGGSTTLTQGGVGYPTQNTTYTYTVTGPDGTATASAAVTLNLVTSFDGMIYGNSPNTDNDVDPYGAVGTKQFMEYVNNFYQAYSKTPPYSAVWKDPQPISTPWATVTGPCYLNSVGLPFIQLDAVIDYDRLANRWVIVGKTTKINDYYLCIAVSSTDDLSSPSLTWQAYDFKLEALPGAPPLLGQNSLGDYYFPDWPKLGIWPDGYYVTMDEQDPDNGYAEVGVLVCTFDRPDILNNSGSISPAACTTVPAPLSNGIYLGHSLIPAEVDGTTPPPTGRDEFMASIENPVNDGATLTSNQFNLWDFHVDWTASPPTLTLVQQSMPLVADYTPGCYLYDPASPSITNCVLEPFLNIQPIVDSVGDRFMPRFAYRNYGSYESFVISHTVQTGPGASGTNPSAFQTGIRWYQLTANGSGTPSVSQSGTISPDTSLFRFLPSIAQDKAGNVAVGYSTSSEHANPGISLSYWNLTASAATTPTEVTIIDGPGEEVDTGNNGVGKWGSYSSMTVDPDPTSPGFDCAFWYVNEYFFNDDTWRTRIAYFQVPGCQ